MSLTATFSALGDPTRRAVVRRLGAGEATVSELAAAHAMSLPAFTKHIGVLVDAGLVSRRKVGRSVLCRLAPDRLREAEGWLTDVTSFWAGNLDRLVDLMAEPESRGRPATRPGASVGASITAPTSQIP